MGTERQRWSKWGLPIHTSRQPVQMPGEVHWKFTNLLCHRALRGAINHTLNLPVSLSRGKLL